MNKLLVKALKFDGKVHRQWNAELLEESADIWSLYGRFDQRIEHPDIGLIRKGTESFEYYWKNRWYNVFRFNEPDGSLKCFYCNVNMPPTLEDGVLSYVDLDLDILVKPDFNFRILDEKEFVSNARTFSYPDETVSKAKEQLNILQGMIRAREFPFGQT